MLYVCFGTDRAAVRDAGEKIIARLTDQYEQIEVARLEGLACEVGQIMSLTDTTSLFGGATAYLIDTPSDSVEIFDEIIREAGHLAESPNHFIVIDTALSAAQRKVLSAVASVMEEFKAGKTERFNTFALADALLRKDKRGLWMALQEAWREEVKTEEIIGILWWQMKLLRLATVTKTSVEAGVSDFPYNKAKRALGRFSPGELERLAEGLLALYHDGHAGKRDIDIALEEWVLRM